MRYVVDTGDRFGRLTVVSFSHHDGRYRRHYTVVCDCGVQKTVQGSLLRSGNTKSCGCLVKDAAKARIIPDNYSAITGIILGYRRHARDRGIEWHLSRDTVSKIVRQPCHYCGVSAGNTFRSKSLPEGFQHNGIDRIDPSDSYHDGNVVPCCGTCNIAKGSRSHDEFIDWAKSIADQWGTHALREAAA